MRSLFNHSFKSSALILLLGLFACGKNGEKFDATGIFEAKEVIISAEAAGKLVQFNIEEGQVLKAGQEVGSIDCTQLLLQKEQLLASGTALKKKTFDPAEQVAVLEKQLLAQKNQHAALQEQMNNLQREQKRVSNLVASKAAPAKQLDDLDGQIRVLQNQLHASVNQLAVIEQQIKAQRSTSAQQNVGILGEEEPLQKRIELLNDQIQKCSIVNPVDGSVLTKYAEPHEVTAPGKPLYKLADLSTMTLRAYVSGSQLTELKTGQTVKVLVDKGEAAYRELAGTVSWISDKAEFTPKTIQTKEERANLVYAVKIQVQNDGFLKIGMYGEVVF